MLRRFLLIAAFALAVPACGGDAEGYRFAVHPADGKVVRNGEPVPGAIVRLHPVDPAAVKIPDGREGPPIMLTTETDDSGQFVFSTYLADDGVPAGDYVVTVTPARAFEDVENSDGRRGAAPRRESGQDKIYRDPATTPLRATVKPGENHYVFELD
jgi:hypothetical protein